MVKILIVVVCVVVVKEVKILIFVVLIVVLEVLEVRFFNFYGYPLMNQNHHLSNFMIMMNLMKNWMKILFFYSFFFYSNPQLSIPSSMMFLLFLSSLYFVFATTRVIFIAIFRGTCFIFTQMVVITSFLSTG